MAAVIFLAMVVAGSGGAFADGADGEDAAVNRLFDAFGKGGGAPLSEDAAERQKLESLARLNEAVRERLVAEVVMALDKDGRLPVYGDGDITVYEFSDYQCGYCRRVFSYLDAAAARGEVQIKVVELPVLGDTSREMAKAALAAWRQGKYEQYHRFLMRAPPPKTDDDIALLGEGLDADAGEISEILKSNFAVANLLGVQGTPAFIINGRYIPGALREEQFLRLIRE